MTYYIFHIQHSQTEENMIVVKAKSREEAETFLKRHGTNGPRYVSFRGEQKFMVVVK